MQHRLRNANALCSRKPWGLPPALGQQRLLRTAGEAPEEVHSGVEGAADIKKAVEGTKIAAQNTDPWHAGLGNGVLDAPQLPLSPLMDPNLQAAHNRYKASKPAASGELSAFQKKLRKNPWAQALATQVRQCNLTGTRLPNFFVLGLGLAPHPQTGKPWVMPKAAVESHARFSNDSLTIESREPNSTTSDEIGAANATPSAPGRPVRTAAGAHIIAKQSAMRLLPALKPRSYLLTLPYRWKQDAGFKADQIVWRKDMDTLVLELMRSNTVRLLQYLSARSAAYIVPCQNYEDIQTRHQAGAVLWLGRPMDDESAIPADPPPYAMIEYKSSGHIPIYNLPTLLGSEHLHQLRATSKQFHGTLAVIKRKHTTTECQLQLWKLLGYLAPDTSAG
ncbi:MAG: hypothetical protein Q9182_001278 [Xanthomendoza sp. 2 TL-2023]